MAPKKRKDGEFTSINIESLNINGISTVKMVLFEDYVIETMPDVIGLQETKVNIMVIRLDGCSESPARRRSHVNYSTIVLPDFV